jgi:hypothetical protein
MPAEVLLLLLLLDPHDRLYHYRHPLLLLLLS